MSKWSAALAGASLVTLSFVGHAHAEPAMQMELRYSQSKVPLDDARFRGTGRDASWQSHTLSASGTELGVLNPRFHMFDFSFLGRGDKIAFGPTFGVGFATGADAFPTNPELASHFKTGNAFTMGRVGLESRFSHAFGALQVYGGLIGGVRFVSIPLVGLVKDSSNCKSSCGASASAVAGYLQPRIGFEIVPTERAPLKGTIGGYFATELLRPGAFELGVTLSMRLSLVPYH